MREPTVPDAPPVARVLRGLIRLTDGLLPGRLVAVYLHGSHRDGTALPTSDLDVVVVLRPGTPDREAAGLRRALAALSLAAAIPLDALVAREDELRRAGAVWLRTDAALVHGSDVAATFVPLSPPQYARLAMHGAVTNLTRLYTAAPLRAPVAPPDPTDPWLGCARQPVRAPDGTDRPGTVLLVAVAFWVAKALALRLGADCVRGKGDIITRAYRQHVGDGWAEFLDELFARCRNEWGYLIPEPAADRATLRTLCERACGFFDHFLGVYRTFLLAETADGMPARGLAVRRLGELFADDEVRATLTRLAAGGEPLATEARAALARVAG